MERTGNSGILMAAANPNNPLLSYLYQKYADVWLEQPTQIEAGMGISGEKKDVDDQAKSIRKKWILRL